MEKLINHFWNWYEDNLELNIAIASFLFVWQAFHLIWLGGDVVALRLLGAEIFGIDGFLEKFIILVDYTEVPAIISVSLIYINDLRKGFNYKSLFYLIFLNSQWLHLFWITDEFIVESLRGRHQTILPAWLAWLAILIDYLELPVMYDTLKRFFVSLFKKAGSKI